MEGILFKRSIKKAFWKSQNYQLVGGKMVRFNGETNKPECFANVENFRLEKIKLEEKGEKEIKYGIRLTHNGKFAELYARSKELMVQWFEALKK